VPTPSKKGGGSKLFLGVVIAIVLLAAAIVGAYVALGT